VKTTNEILYKASPSMKNNNNNNNSAILIHFNRKFIIIISIENVTHTTCCTYEFLNKFALKLIERDRRRRRELRFSCILPLMLTLTTCKLPASTNKRYFFIFCTNECINMCVYVCVCQKHKIRSFANQVNTKCFSKFKFS